MEAFEGEGGGGDGSSGADRYLFFEQCDFTEDQTAGRSFPDRLSSPPVKGTPLQLPPICDLAIPFFPWKRTPGFPPPFFWVLCFLLTFFLPPLLL